MTDWDHGFADNGYTPLNRPDVERCPRHPGHAILDGQCTSGHPALPTVRDDEDRIADALKETDGADQHIRDALYSTPSTEETT